MNKDKDIKKDTIVDRHTDKTVISTKNVIPTGRMVTRDDVKNFVEKLKEEKKKLTNENKVV